MHDKYRTVMNFRKILIANRGEIAVRIMRTCRKMGIATVGVYSDFDVNACHTRTADESVRLESSSVADCYLNIEAILNAAKRSGVQAIHPGYGFLSENAAFAEACRDAGIVFIGPSPESMRAMGDKSVARRLAAAAGLPVISGYDGSIQDPAHLRKRALEIGLPVMVKAAAGGGGKGMRVVRDAKHLDEAIEAAAREATRAFGDSRLLIEKHLDRARHIEVQIIGDQDGRILHLFDRECSLQRRHQKVIEEGPAPFLSSNLRLQMCEMAVALGRSIGYYGAGTVEFLVTPEDECFFIEVNARLQVEHPVTEMVTGLDLVKLQIEIAEGRPLPLSQLEIIASGHSVEARLYAEDPTRDFLPAIGTVKVWSVPENIEGLRIDTAIGTGTEVGIHYDPLLAKVIVHAEDRAQALGKLAWALRRSFIHGLSTNREFLIRLAENRSIREGGVATSFIADHLGELTPGLDRDFTERATAAVALYLRDAWSADNPAIARLPYSYRNNPYRRPSVTLDVARERIEVTWEHAVKDQTLARGDVQTRIFVSGRELSVVVCERSAERIRLEIDGTQYAFSVQRDGETFFVDHPSGSVAVVKLARHPVPERETDLESANAPMPGQVLKILVEPGQHVEVGETLVILEAMKMEQAIRASIRGIVEEVMVRPREIVSPGDILVRISATEKDRE